MATLSATTTPMQNLPSYPELLSKVHPRNLVDPLSLEQRTLCIVGEALGADEDAQREYFVGKAGKLLDKLLRDLGLIRSTIHITNVVKIRPPDNKLERLEEYGLTIQDFIPLLKEELSAVNPVAILALGATAMEALTSELGISKWRGSTLPCTLHPTATVIPTYHPSYLQRGQMDQYPYVRNDIKRFGEFGFSFYTPEVPYSSIIDPSITQAIDFLQSILDSATSTCFDIETVAKQRITCIGFSHGPNSAICIPFRHQGLKLRWAEHEQIILLDLMRQIFAKPGLCKIAQHIHFDLHNLLPLLGFPREPLFDIRYAHQLIHPDMPHDLGFMTSVYTNMNYHKDDVSDWSEKNLPHDTTLWEYNIKDVITTHRIKDRLVQDLKELNLYDFYVGYTTPFRRVIFEMEEKGIKIDTTLRDEWTEFVENEELPIALDIINKMAGQELNPNSSKQLGTYLESIGVVVPRTAKGNYTVKEETIEDLIVKYPHHRTFLKQVLCTRVLKAKELGTYLRAPISPDGRMRTEFGYTVTGRLTSKKNHNDEGTNLQNQPKYLRSMYIPEPGHVFLDPDLKAAEAMCVAYEIKSDKMKAVFETNKKIHQVVGEWIYDKPYTQLTPEEYHIAKITVHGSNYNMGIHKFARTIGKSLAEARLVREKYFSVVPELKAWHSYVNQEMESTRKLSNFFGRSRIFTGRLDQETFNSGYAQKPQSTVGDIINLGTLGLWLIKPQHIYITTQIHDQILISLPPNDIDWFKPYIVAHLETLRPVRINGDLLTIPIEFDPPKSNWYGK